MLKQKIYAGLMVVLASMFVAAVPVKADTATANAMVPVLRAMYQVDQAEAILESNKEMLRSCRANNANAYQKAVAQAAVTDATNLLNSLNTMIARDTTLIQAAPAGVVNAPTFAVNSMNARGAWYDYYNKLKLDQAGIFPVVINKKSGSVPRVYTPFCMY